MTYDQQTFLGWSYGWCVTAAAVAVLICAIATDSHGRSVNNHTNPLPSGVVQISKSQYIVQPNTVPVASICRGSTPDHDPVGKLVDLPQLRHASFVQCVKQQTWDDHRPQSPNFGRGIILTLINPAWYLPTGGWLALTTLLAGWWGIRGRARDRKLAKIEAKKVSMDLEQKRRELRQAYARDEINDLEFQTAMDRLYSQGLPPAKDD